MPSMLGCLLSENLTCTFLSNHLTTKCIEGYRKLMISFYLFDNYFEKKDVISCVFGLKMQCSDAAKTVTFIKKIGSINK